MHATVDGSLWIGYAGKAIARVKDGHYMLMNGVGSLVPDAVSQFASDKSGALWLAGTRGMYRVTLADAVAKAEGRTPLLPPVFYGRAEGLPSLQPLYDSFPTVSESRQGTLFFSTSLGVLAVTPENLRANPVPPPVFLDAVLVDEQPVAVRDPKFPLRPAAARRLHGLGAQESGLELAPDHRRITFEFSALSYSGSENVRYRYRLDGFDETWTDPGAERQAQYSRLPAGDYLFRVTACNDTGVWSATPAAIAVSVRPFLWQRWWFRAIVLIVFTAAVAAVVRWVSFRRLQARLRSTERDAALFQERTRIARDIHDDLGGSLAHIKLLSEIAVQDRGMPDSTEVHLRQITATTQQVLKSLDETIWAISPGNDTLPHLVSYLGQYAVEFLRAAGISCRVDLPDSPPEIEIASGIRHHVYLAFKEALTNVVRHSGARKVDLRVTVKDRVLRIVVEDDGRGLGPETKDAHADGLPNMRQRMSAVGGTLTVRSQPGKGTHLEFVLSLEPRP
jgi:signal transduction histidine kinase